MIPYAAIPTCEHVLRTFWNPLLMGMTAAEIVSRLDERPAPAKSRSEIAYRILRETNQRDELVDIILDQYRGGFTNAELLETLMDRLSSSRMESGGLADKPLLHIAWGLFPEQDELDGYLAEYYYDWASRLGIPEEKVSNIILDLGAA